MVWDWLELIVAKGLQTAPHAHLLASLRIHPHFLDHFPISDAPSSRGYSEMGSTPARSGLVDSDRTTVTQTVTPLLHLDRTRVEVKSRNWNLRPGSYYCFSATNVVVLPVSLLVMTSVNFFPSAETVIFTTSTTLPSRLAVCSIVRSSTRRRETEV